jgi:N6-L-threonylcarbamoyladenine synthase
VDLISTRRQFRSASRKRKKIKNLDISGKDYQNGDQMGFWNVGEYVLFRDGHACHGRKGCKNPILDVHNIESRKIGGDAPNNLTALCKDCHDGYRDAHGHRGAAFGIGREN